MELSPALKRLKPSSTIVLAAKAKKLKDAGHNVINFAVGEPDFPSSPWVCQAGKDAIDAGYTRYTPADGLPVLKAAIQEKFKRENNISYDLSEITVSNGGKQVLFNAMLATLYPGDEVIIPTPYWVSYPEVVSLFGGKPVFIETSAKMAFKMTPQQLEEAITPHTKWVIINSPSNPSGCVYTKEELRAFADILLKHPHVLILSDDIYEHLLLNDETFYNIVMVEPQLRERVLILHGVSKSYAMTGWRIGYAAGPQKLIKALTNLQSQSTSHPASVAQMAAVAAINGDQKILKEQNNIMKARRDLIMAEINSIPGLSLVEPQGAFYAYVNCQGAIGRVTPEGNGITNDADVSTYLLDNHMVAVVPGESFGLSPYFRMSYALSNEDLIEGCARVRQAMEDLHVKGSN